MIFIECIYGAGRRTAGKCKLFVAAWGCQYRNNWLCIEYPSWRRTGREKGLENHPDTAGLFRWEINGCVHFNRLTVEDIRSVLPLPNSFDGGCHQGCGSADFLGFNNTAVSADQKLQ